MDLIRQTVAATFPRGEGFGVPYRPCGPLPPKGEAVAAVEEFLGGRALFVHVAENLAGARFDAVAGGFTAFCLDPCGQG